MLQRIVRAGRRGDVRRPQFVTFDILGTILDWRSGLDASCRAAGRPLRGKFDRIVDAQAELEQGSFVDYATVTERSLTSVLGLEEAEAAVIGAEVGAWPLYPDAAVPGAMMQIATCGAMTNSDRVHGQQIQAQLGFCMDVWLCAEDTRIYKPDPGFWLQMSRLRGLEPSPAWWHVSAHADYDLDVANQLGLTTVLVIRPHSRPGTASHVVQGLEELLDLVQRM